MQKIMVAQMSTIIKFNLKLQQCQCGVVGVCGSDMLTHACTCLSSTQSCLQELCLPRKGQINYGKIVLV